MIAVVGGGITGLALAYALQRQGKPVKLLEGAPRVGGNIGTTSKNGFLTEWGPNGFLDREPATRELITQLGLDSKLRSAEPEVKRRLVYARGALREVPSSPPAFLRSEVLSLKGRMRALAEVALKPRGSGRDESLADFGRRHFGAEATETLLDALQTGTYAGDIERLSAHAAFPQLLALEQEHGSLLRGLIGQPRKKAPNLLTLDGGLETLVSALGLALGAAVIRGERALAIQRVDDRWRLTLESRGGRSTLDVDAVVLAVPAYAAADLLRPLDEPLANELAAIEYSGVAAVHLGYRQSDLRQRPRGFGLIVPAHEARPLLGTIFVSRLFPWRSPDHAELFTCIVGGVRRPELAQLEEDALVVAARHELRAMMGVGAEPIFHHVLRWPRGIPQYNVGHLARVGSIEGHAARWPGLYITGNAFRGVGLNDCVRAAGRLAPLVRAGTA
jgi:oxygen-dependent protoporphyrinogen oxidase